MKTQYLSIILLVVPFITENPQYVEATCSTGLHVDETAHSRPASNPTVLDTFGKPITGTVKLGQQIQILEDFTNEQDCDKTFAYLLQIQDINGVTVSLSWITGTLHPGQSLSPAQSWIPPEAGTYEAQTFVWKSLKNPDGLLPPESVTITVESPEQIVTPVVSSTNAGITAPHIPVIINQVELDSAFAFFPDNQTCYDKPGFVNNYTCSIDIIPGHKVQCTYFLGASSCEPIHQYTSGTNRSCFGPDGSPNAPQWFDLYNTQNKTVQIQLFQLIILQGQKPWGNEGLFPTKVNLGPHEKCTIGLGPLDEPLSLDQTNMGFAASYTFEGKNYTATTPPMTDISNDSKTWQFDGNKWTFAEQNTIPVPEFPFAITVLIISVTSLIIFYRIKFK